MQELVAEVNSAAKISIRIADAMQIIILFCTANKSKMLKLHNAAKNVS